MPATIPYPTAQITHFIAAEVGAIPTDVVSSDSVKQITGATATNPAVVTTVERHNYRTGDKIIITGASQANLNNGGAALAVTVLSPTTFSVPVSLGGASTGGTCQLVTPARRLMIEFPTADWNGNPATAHRDIVRLRNGLDRLYGARFNTIDIQFTGTP